METALITLTPLIDRLVRAVVIPTTPPNVVAPPELVAKLKAPSTVEPNEIAPLDVLVNVVSAPKVNALE
jgi:hypothetical protein